MHDSKSVITCLVILLLMIGALTQQNLVISQHLPDLQQTESTNNKSDFPEILCDPITFDQNPTFENNSVLSSQDIGVFVPMSVTSQDTLVPSLDYVFSNNAHMQILFNSSFPADCIVPVCDMLSQLILPQLSEKFWTPNVNSTIYVYNLTSTLYGGQASAGPVKLDPQGKATTINGSVWINNNILNITASGKLSSYTWTHEFTHIFQMCAHTLSSNWVTEAQASFMPYIVFGPNGVDYTCYNRAEPEYAVVPNTCFSSDSPSDGIAFYLESKTNWLTIYQGAEGWARLYTWDNQIFKKFYERLSSLPYNYWYINNYGSERYIREMVTQIINATTIDNVNINQWFDAHCFCDFGTIPLSTPYFRWKISIQNTQNIGTITVNPVYFKNGSSSVSSEPMNYSVELYNALTGDLLLNQTGTVVNQTIGSLFSPATIGSPQAITARIIGNTCGQTIVKQKTFFDTSGKSQYNNSTMVRIAVKNDNTRLEPMLGSLNIVSQNYSKTLSVDASILQLSQSTFEADAPINLTLVEPTNKTIVNFILMRVVDDIFFQSQIKPSGAPSTSDDYSNLWLNSGSMINLTSQGPNGVANIFYSINERDTMNVNDSGQPKFNSSNSFLGNNNTLEYWSQDDYYNVEYPHKTATNIKMDWSYPTGSIIINGGNTSCNLNNVTLTLTSNDVVSGVSQVRCSNDGTSWVPWETASSTRGWILAAGDGTKTVYYQIKDNAGNIANFSRTIILDTIVPTGSITINNGTTYTSTISVALSLTYNDSNGVSRVCYSNDGLAWGSWEYASSTRSWVLASGDGTKTVYYQIRDNAGNTVNFSKSIILDATPPTGSITVNNGASYTNITIVNLVLSANDTGSGVSTMRFSNDTTTWSSWEAYAASKSWTLLNGDGSKIVYVQFRDNAGSISLYGRSIFLDMTAPVANAGQSQTAVQGFSAAFNGGGSTDNAGIASYTWDFGDGSKGSGAYSTHIYSTAGTYVAKLTVQDFAGNTASGTVTTTVQSIQPTPTPTPTPSPTPSPTPTPTAGSTSTPIPAITASPIQTSPSPQNPTASATASASAQTSNRTPSPSPTIPEFPYVTILALLAFAILALTVVYKKMRTTN